MSEEEERRSQELSISTIKKTHSQERDQSRNRDGSESFRKAAPCSLDTSMPPANDGIQGAQSNEMPSSGRIS
jgi:hypothetical protein